MYIDIFCVSSLPPLIQEYSFQLLHPPTMLSPHLAQQALKLPHPLAGPRSLPPLPPPLPPLLNQKRPIQLPQEANFLLASPPMSTERLLLVQQLTRERKFTSISTLSSIRYSMIRNSGRLTGTHTHCQGMLAQHISIKYRYNVYIKVGFMVECFIVYKRVKVEV